mmetsp:Transcript_40957/g.53956  ORF Transcript_40957/g.53956 Transcript_40957/m.53956 type:complete len:1681 (+) Transcript_40957:54-5096(+)
MKNSSLQKPSDKKNGIRDLHSRVRRESAEPDILNRSTQKYDKMEHMFEEIVSAVDISQCSPYTYVACGVLEKKDAQNEEPTVVVGRIGDQGTELSSEIYMRFKGLGSISGLGFCSDDKEDPSGVTEYLVASDYSGNYAVCSLLTGDLTHKEGAWKLQPQCLINHRKINTLAVSPKQSSQKLVCFGTPKAALLMKVDFPKSHTLSKRQITAIDQATLELVIVFPRKGDVHGLAFFETASDDKESPLRLAVGGWDMKVDIYCLKTYKPVFTVKVSNRIVALSVSPNGHYLAFGGLGQSVEVYSFFKLDRVMGKELSQPCDSELPRDPDTTEEVYPPSPKMRPSNNNDEEFPMLDNAYPRQVLEGGEEDSNLPSHCQHSERCPIAGSQCPLKGHKKNNDNSEEKNQTAQESDVQKREIWEKLDAIEMDSDVLSLSLAGEGGDVKMAVGLDDNMVQVYHVGTGALLTELKRRDRVGAVALSTSERGTYLAAGDYSKWLLFYNVHGGFGYGRYNVSTKNFGKNSMFTSVAISANSQYLATTADGGEIYWYRTEDLMSIQTTNKKGSPRRRPSNPNVECSEPSVDPLVEYYTDATAGKRLYALALTPEGKTVAAGGQGSGNVWLLKMKNDETLDFVCIIECCHQVWDLCFQTRHGEKQEATEQKGHPREQQCCEGFSILAIGDCHGQVYICNTDNLKDNYQSEDQALHSDEICNPQKYPAQELSLVKGGELHRNDHIYCLSMSASCELLGVGARDKQVNFYSLSWEYKGGKLVLDQVKLLFQIHRLDRIYTMSMSPDGLQVAMGGAKKVVHVYEIVKNEQEEETKGTDGDNKGHELERFRRGGIIRQAAFTAGRLVAVLADDGFVVVYSTEKGNLGSVFQTPVVDTIPGRGVSFSYLGCMVTLSKNMLEVYGSCMKGYTLFDRPAFEVMKSLLKNPSSLKTVLDANQSLVNSVEENTGKSLLQVCVEQCMEQCKGDGSAEDTSIDYAEDISIDYLLSAGCKVGLLIDKDMNSALHAALKHKGVLEKILDAIIDERVTDNDYSLQLFMNNKELPGSKQGPDSQQNQTGSKQQRHPQPLFQQIGEAYPDLLLKFLSKMPLKKCHKRVLGSQTFKILHALYGLSEERNPSKFWDERLKKHPAWYEVLKGLCGRIGRHVNDKPQALPVHVAAYRIPFQGFADYFNEIDNASVFTSNCSPLYVIVKAACTARDNTVFNEHTIVHALVQHKWRKTKLYFYGESIVFFLYLILATFCAITVYSENDQWHHDATLIFDSHVLYTNAATAGPTIDINNSFVAHSDFDHPLSHSGWKVIVILSVTSLFFLREMVQFFGEIKNTGSSREALKTYLFSFWNMVDLVAFTMQYVTAALFLNRIHRWLQVTAAIALLFLYLKLFYYARGYKEFGILVTMILQTIKRVATFLIVMVIILVGFSIALLITLYDMPLEDEEQYFNSFPHALRSTILIIFGEYSSIENALYDGGKFIFLVYVTMVFLVVLVLFNLVIAIMNDSYAEVRDHAKIGLALDRAELIVEAESLKKILLSVYHFLRKCICTTTQNNTFAEENLATKQWVHVLAPHLSLERRPFSRKKRQDQFVHIVKKLDKLETRQSTFETYLENTNKKLDTIIMMTLKESAPEEAAEDESENFQTATYGCSVDLPHPPLLVKACSTPPRGRKEPIDKLDMRKYQSAKK